MHQYVGYTIPLSNDQVFALVEFGEIQWIPPIKSICKWEFILHTYESGEVQYEALVGNTIFVYTEDQLKGTKACPSGHFKEQDGICTYHLNDYEVYSLQTQEEIKLFDLDDNSDIVHQGQFRRINLGGNYKNITWVGDILVYYYDTDRSAINRP
jgi:hypothetical protein